MLSIKFKHDNHMDRLCHTIKVIPREYLEAEAELMLTKWPAYRFMSPVEATDLFHVAYVDGYKQYHHENAARDEAEGLGVGKKLRRHKQTAHYTQVWVARQKADMLGVPYPEYIEFAFKFAGARKDRKYAPQPNQLGPNPKTKDAWRAKFNDFWDDDRYKLALNRMEALPQYAVEFDRGLPAQQRYREELLDLGARPEVRFENFYAQHVIVRGDLSLNDCETIATSEALAIAEKSALWDLEHGIRKVQEYSTPEAHEFYQSCFGIPGVDVSDASSCGSCPHFTICGAARAEALERVEMATGSTDPIAEKKKADTRKRVAKHRARKKALLSEPAAGARAHPSDPVSVTSPELLFLNRCLENA